MESKYSAQIASGQGDEARVELLHQAYVAAPDPDAQELFLRLFERPDEPDRGAEEALTQLAAADDAVRRKSARRLSSLARGNRTKKRKTWLTDPRVVASLLTATETANDKLAIELVGALGALSRRYEFPDPRILDRFLTLWERGNDALKIAIVGSIGHFGGERVWRIIVDGSQCRPAKAAQYAVASAAYGFGGSAPARERLQVARALEAASSKQKNLDVLLQIALALEVVGDASSVMALEQLKARVDDPAVVESVERAIAACAQR